MMPLALLFVTVATTTSVSPRPQTSDAASPILQTLPGAPAGVHADCADRIVCEEQEEIGTRLGSMRICRRVSEWAAERRAGRAEIEKDENVRGLSPTAGGRQ